MVNRIFTKLSPSLVAIWLFICLMTGCSDNGINVSTESITKTDQGGLNEAISEAHFSYNSDESWHTPRLVNSQKYPFCINHLVYSEDGETIYIASDLSEVHTVNAADGKIQAVYQLDKPAVYLLLKDHLLYCLSFDTVEIWDTTTDQRINTISYQSPGLSELDDIADAMVVNDMLYLLRGNYSVHIQNVHLSDGFSEFYTFQNREVTMSETAVQEYDSFFLDSKNGRLLAKEDREGIVYCLDLTSDTLKTFDGVFGTEFFVNNMTGTLFIFTKTEDENYHCSISCQTYDAEYNFLKEVNWDLGDQYEGMFSSYIPIDVTADDTLILMQEGYGSFLVLNVEENNNYRSIENHVRNHLPAAFVNSEFVFISPKEISDPWELYNVSTGMCQIRSEISGCCSIVKSKHGFVLYKTNGTVAVYSHDLSENIDSLSEKPDLVTNPFNGGLWSEESKDNIAAISSDGKYKIKWELNQDDSLHYANRDSAAYCSYWMINGITGESLFCIQFPTDSFVSVAVRDDSCAALINRAGVYYEFNPQNGEVYRSGMLEMPDHVDLYAAQFVVDFENQLASVIYKLSNFSYDGALYSTETFERLFDYGSASGYMTADLQCEHIYYRDCFSGEDLVMTLEKKK